MSDRPTHQGEPLMSCEELAVLLGVPEEELTVCVNAQRDPGNSGLYSVRIPDEWIEQGRSRTEIYQQATGRNDFHGALEFWRSQRAPSRRDDDNPGGVA